MRIEIVEKYREKIWVAEITDVSAQYGYVREFVKPTSAPKRGKTGTKTYDLPDGYYQAGGGRDADDLGFFKVKGDDLYDYDPKKVFGSLE